MVELLQSADERTLVIALISGGGSSLMALPVERVSLQDYKDISKLLLTVPATIDEINAVRKHLDPLKGGGMRKYAAGAGGFISLVLSDVPVTKTGIVDDTSVIASGPTVGDDSTFQMAQQVLTEHKIWDQAPQAVREYIEANLGKQEQRDAPQELAALDRGKEPVRHHRQQRPGDGGRRRKGASNWAMRSTWSAGTPARPTTRSRPR